MIAHKMVGWSVLFIFFVFGFYLINLSFSRDPLYDFKKDLNRAFNPEYNKVLDFCKSYNIDDVWGGDLSYCIIGHQPSRLYYINKSSDNWELYRWDGYPIKWTLIK